MKFIVIGITDHPKPFFQPEVMEAISLGEVFSGGRRHHEIVSPFLPDDAEWIDITVPLDAVFERYKEHFSLHDAHRSSPVIVFASGDPLFFGFANTIRRKMPDAEIVLYPSFNSLQMLAHRLVLPYHNMRIVSLTGRPWPEFDKALIEHAEMIGVLTDREHTPAAISSRMLEYGYNAYTIHVGEHLGNPELEKVSSMTLEEAAKLTFDYPNCIILEADNSQLSTGIRPSFFGIPDHEFALLDGREKMITKMPIRLLTLQALELQSKRVFWDIGFCTGSVSIEARLQFPHLTIHAFEIRNECEALMSQNSRRFGAPGIQVHIGDFMEADVSAIPCPDAVFIGGHGGRLKEIMTKVRPVLADGGCIVMNSVTSDVVRKVTDRPDSKLLFKEACAELGLRQEPSSRIKLNEFNPIEILKCRK